MKTDTTYRRSRVQQKDLTSAEKWQEFLRNKAAAITVLLVLSSILFPNFLELMLGTAALLTTQLARVPYPYLEPNPEVEHNRSNTPLYCFGIETTEKRPVWASKSNMQQHTLVMGTTGAGKTELLLFLTAQAMAHGSGVLFVDGKADIKTWFRLFAIATRLGVEENLLILNFGTNIEEGQSRYDLTNTLNPFVIGSANELAEMMSDLMASAGGDNAMWKGRAESMMRTLLTALVYLRDKLGLSIGAGTLADFMPLDAMESLLGVGSRINDPRFQYVLPKGSLAEIELTRYLDNLPGYTRPQQGAAPGTPQQQNKGREEANKQHGFLTMQFVEILGLLNNSYRHMMGFDNAEVDIYDCIINRRSLYVMLPSMEKSAGTIANLGKIIVNQIRSALSKTLGAAGVKGSKLEKLESRPTNSETPALCILDEYGSYAPKGFGEVAAQARSIGFATIFAVQDYASLKKADDGRGDEALRIWANTNTKVIMKLEDSKETLQILKERIGQGLALSLKGKETKQNSLFGGGWVPLTTVSYDQVLRLEELEMYDFEYGRMAIINKSNIWKVQSTFLDNEQGAWKDLDFVYPQRFVPLSKPDIVTIANEIAVLKRVIEGKDNEGVSTVEDENLDNAFMDALALFKEETKQAEKQANPLRYGYAMAAFLARSVPKNLHAAKQKENTERNLGRVGTRNYDEAEYEAGDYKKVLAEKFDASSPDFSPPSKRRVTDYQSFDHERYIGSSEHYDDSAFADMDDEDAEVIYPENIMNKVPLYGKSKYMSMALESGKELLKNYLNETDTDTSDKDTVTNRTGIAASISLANGSRYSDDSDTMLVDDE